MEENTIKSVETKVNTLEKTVNMVVSILREKDWTKKLLLLDIFIFIFYHLD